MPSFSSPLILFHALLLDLLLLRPAILLIQGADDGRARGRTPRAPVANSGPEDEDARRRAIGDALAGASPAGRRLQKRRSRAFRRARAHDTGGVRSDVPTPSIPSVDASSLRLVRFGLGLVRFWSVHATATIFWISLTIFWISFLILLFVSFISKGPEAQDL